MRADMMQDVHSAVVGAMGDKKANNLFQQALKILREETNDGA